MRNIRDDYLKINTMQTFLPYPDMYLSLRSLDNVRLNSQIKESGTLIKAISDSTKKGWKNHPAKILWEENLEALKSYYNLGLIIWLARGFNSNRVPYAITEGFDLPHWWGDEDFHRSHRENLVRKDLEYYGIRFPDDDESDWYVWFDRGGNKYKQQKGTKTRVYYA